MTLASYEAVAANVAQVHVDGTSVRVNWKCPVTGREMGESTAYMAADPSIPARVGASVKRSVVSEVVYGLARFLAGLLPGAAGRVFNNAVYTAANDISTRATAGTEYTDASRRDAIVAAFESVRDRFTWDEVNKRFVGR